MKPHRYPAGSPEARRAGSAILGGYCPVLVQLAGDLDHYCKWFDLPRCSAHAKPYSKCKASFEGPNSWMDNRHSSGWQQTLLTVENWRTYWTSTNPLFELPGMSGLSVSLDFMHCHFLGWLQNAYGSTVHLLFDDRLHGSGFDKLQHIERFLQQWQRDHGCRYFSGSD